MSGRRGRFGLPGRQVEKSVRPFREGTHTCIYTQSITRIVIGGYGRREGESDPRGEGSCFFGFAGGYLIGFIADTCLLRVRIQGGICHLGGVEETGSVGAPDGVDEHGVGDAGDEIADVFVAGERGHGLTVGPVGVGSR